MHPKEILIDNYFYDLPEERIAKFPLARRDQSRLLIFNNGLIKEDVFSNIDDLLPTDGILVFNETKVIQARLQFFKESGAKIEIFCLEPISPTPEIQLAFQQKEFVVWKCFIGNAKKWKAGSLYKTISVKGKEVTISIAKVEMDGEAQLIKFEWDEKEFTFAQILNAAGLVPLPPYINRKAVAEDKERYQTVYAMHDGSVAAPTAGLHFTKDTLNRISQKNIPIEKVTLHVGAGTFKPVSTELIGEHEMHTEKIIIQRSTLERLSQSDQKKVIAVGTTSVRTLESLYWFACKLKHKQNAEFYIHQWDPYLPEYHIEMKVKEVFDRILNYMDQMGTDTLRGETQLMIAPSYVFKIVDVLITNFHQPKSTLLLLVSAFIGDQWRHAYEYALKHNFRFLSYGDSCLFFKKQ